MKMNNKGFSLVELIVVIAIMAILVGVLAPSVTGQVDKSRKSKDDQNLDGLAAAMATAITDDLVSSSPTVTAYHKVFNMPTDKTFNYTNMACTSSWMVSTWKYLGDKSFDIGSTTYTKSTVTIVVDVDAQYRINIKVMDGTTELLNITK